MINTQTIEIAKKIGEFYLSKNDGDYDKASDEIIKLLIIKIEFTQKNEVAITTGRPGTLIGKRGLNIKELSTHLGQPVKIIEAEDCIMDWLIPSRWDANMESQAYRDAWNACIKSQGPPLEVPLPYDDLNRSVDEN